MSLCGYGQAAQKFRVAQGIGGQTQTQQAVAQHQREAQHAVEQQDSMHRALIPRREEALGLTLIAAVIRHVEKQAAKQHGPKPEVALAAQARIVEQGQRALRKFRQVLQQLR